MAGADRRSFLKLVGSGLAVAAVPGSIAKALAVPAHRRTGTIADVEHIVILTQENRSFDHYFGSLRGVRGFNDPRAVILPNGKPVWYQPNGGGEVVPFRPFNDMGMRFLPDPDHGWNSGHAAWNQGQFDRWIAAKGVNAMPYHLRRDIPYHYALADAFTICDAYHCSVMGPTDPNRYHLWTGWLGNDGTAGGPVISNAEVGYDWYTFPERLQEAGISWKVYQDVGDGLTPAAYWGWTGDAYIGNYGDNSLLYFHQYQNAPPTDPLARGAKVGTNISALGRNPDRLFDMLRDDVKHGRLPQVSWIAAPEAYSEHPNWAPAYGAWYTSRVVDILASNPEVFGKTALFIHFDEEGGFFDHQVPATPPQTSAQGLSTVSIANEVFAGDGSHASGPYGLGIRVPMIVVSPWTRGGFVNSQLFDHTSLIKFIETRFVDEHPEVYETNITPWRRAVTGDLTSVFDFTSADDLKHIVLPPTGSYEPTNLVPHPSETIVAPATPSMPTQERGVRPARALPYEMHATGTANAGSFTIDFRNSGAATVVFQVRSAVGAALPRTYTVEPDQRLIDGMPVARGDYDLFVYGPSGFFRRFKGGLGAGRANLFVHPAYDSDRDAVLLAATNRGPRRIKIRVSDRYSREHVDQTLEPGESTSRYWSAGHVHNWYDLVITVADDSGFQYECAGHIENGRTSMSDPMMGGLV